MTNPKVEAAALDDFANSLASEKETSPKAARFLIPKVDRLADTIEIYSYTREALNRREAECFAGNSNRRIRSTWKVSDASTSAALKKADLCVKIAHLVLKPDASDEAIESMAVELMSHPEQQLQETFDRLTNSPADQDLFKWLNRGEAPVEAPCPQCGRPNDVGVKTCWCCGNTLS